jgi:nitrogen fixation protein NifX
LNYRIAVASKDGKVVTDHFGHCARFIIVEADNNSYKFIEQREVIPPCNGGVHTIKGIEEVIETLKDCEYILVNQVGGGAEHILKDNKFKVIVYRGYVQEALEQILLNHSSI